MPFLSAWEAAERILKAMVVAVGFVLAAKCLVVFLIFHPPGKLRAWINRKCSPNRT